MILLGQVRECGMLNALGWKLEPSNRPANRPLFTLSHPSIKISIYPYRAKNTRPDMSARDVSRFISKVLKLPVYILAYKVA